MQSSNSIKDDDIFLQFKKIFKNLSGDARINLLRNFLIKGRIEEINLKLDRDFPSSFLLELLKPHPRDPIIKDVKEAIGRVVNKDLNTSNFSPYLEELITLIGALECSKNIEDLLDFLYDDRASLIDKDLEYLAYRALISLKIPSDELIRHRIIGLLVRKNMDPFSIPPLLMYYEHFDKCKIPKENILNFITIINDDDWLSCMAAAFNRLFERVGLINFASIIEYLLEDIPEHIFNLNLDHRKYLKDGLVNNRLKEIFLENKQPLSSDANISTIIDKKWWEIVDDNRKYDIKYADKHLKTYVSDMNQITNSYKILSQMRALHVNPIESIQVERHVVRHLRVRTVKPPPLETRISLSVNWVPSIVDLRNGIPGAIMNDMDCRVFIKDLEEYYGK